jgi:tol-pal system protein YbgF
MVVLTRYRNRRALALAALLAITSAGCSKLPWPGSSADNTPPETPAAEAPASNLSDLQSMVAQDHQAIQQLAERNRQLEEEVRQLKEQTVPAPPVAASGPTSESQMAAINQRLTKLESASTAVQSTLSRAIGRAVRPPKESNEEPVALPSYDALLDHEIGLTEGEHRQQLADETYHEGLIALRGFRWATAIDKFESLIRRYPRSQLVEKSRYFSAIAYYQDGKYDSAIVKFRDFVTRYPRSQFTSTAMLNLALAYEQVKDQGDARATLKKVMADYPGSPEATVAQATLKSMEPGPAEARQVNRE